MDKIIFIKAVIEARVLQLYYHNAHHLTAGESFFADHAFFNEAYLALEENYDNLAEQYISAFGKEAFETKAIAILVSNLLEEHQVEKMDCEEMFSHALQLEDSFYDKLTELDEEAPIGLRNLIGAIAEASDVRKYKIKQRLQEE